MPRAVPRAHVIDRTRIWRLVAAVLMVAMAMTLIELWARPDAWRPALLSAAFPMVGAPFAWRIGPRLSPIRSFRLGLTFLVLGVVAVTISLVGWLGTPMAGAVTFYYVLITVFAALFFERRHVIGLLSCWTAAMAIALLSDGFSPDDLLLWTLATSVGWSTGLILHDVRATAERLSYADPLTGAANRREWDLLLDDAVRQHARAGGPLAVLFIDIDDFKSINDTDGHERGDEVLCDAVTAWRAAIRSSDTLARVGGDEFAILLPGATLGYAHEVAERLLRAITAATGSSCSIGVAATERIGEAPLLTTTADRQLYIAKTSGRARVVAATVTANNEPEPEPEPRRLPSSNTVRGPAR